MNKHVVMLFLLYIINNYYLIIGLGKVKAKKRQRERSVERRKYVDFRERCRTGSRSSEVKADKK